MNKGWCWFIISLKDNLTASARPLWRSRPGKKIARWSGLTIGCIGFLQLAHFQECHQERQRRFRALILVGAVGMQAVAAPTRGGIIEGNLQIIVSEEPIESGPRFFAPAALPGCAISLQEGGYGGAGFDGLLVEAGFLRFLRVEAVGPDGNEVASYFAALNRREPIQSFQPGRNHRIVCAASSARMSACGKRAFEYARTFSNHFQSVEEWAR